MTLPAHQRHSATSRDAAKSVASKAETLRAQVLAHIANCGERGATDEEIQLALGMAGNTQRPRRCELAKAGRIKEQGRRKTSTGRSAVVWVIKTTEERNREEAPLYVHADGQCSLFPEESERTYFHE